MQTTKPKIKITHPDKLLYPEDKITKQDMVAYYHYIYKWIRPYIVNRPLTIVRCPNGYKKCFYQKHIVPSTSSALHTITIKEKEGQGEYIYLNDEAGLITLAQMGILEIHPWGSTNAKIEYPDIIVFDLDPAPDVSWEKIVEAAFNIKKHLTELKLQSFIKTTGGKGLHVVIPIKPKDNWQAVKNFTHVFTDLLTMENPNHYINKMTKAKRKGKIFIDYLRNQRGATAVAPYSSRARLHAPVATPIHWDELSNDIRDTFFYRKNLT